MRRMLLAAALLALPASSSAQAVVNGVPLGPSFTLADSRLNPLGVSMSWNPATSRYEGAGNGLTYWVARGGLSGEWSLWLVDPAGAVASELPSWQVASSYGAPPVVYRGFVPSCGPLWRAYGITSEYQPKGLVTTLTP